ncbi:protein kinase [Myxococcota bacterium]|nr:protein kinase [Myxococcota bacterium]
MGPTDMRLLPRPYGGYELLERMGSGAMAEIFRARRAGAAGFERYVVIKRLLPQLAQDPRYVELFVGEAKLAAEIQHKNVVQVLELGLGEDGELFIAMEEAGIDLVRLLERARAAGIRVPPWLAVHIVTEVLEALAFAYDLVDANGRRRNVVHRDVTPANVFVSPVGDVKLGDFGLAKDGSRPDTWAPLEAHGSPAYMAPELHAGTLADHRSDLFAAGVILWEGLTGRRLFDAPTVPEMKSLVWRAPRIAPSELAPDVPAELDPIVLSTLEIDPERRPRSARELSLALRDVLTRMNGSRQIIDVRTLVGRILSTSPRGRLEVPSAPQPPSASPFAPAPVIVRSTASSPPPLPPTTDALPPTFADADPGESLAPRPTAPVRAPTGESAPLRIPKEPSGPKLRAPTQERPRVPTSEGPRTSWDADGVKTPSKPLVTADLPRIAPRRTPTAEAGSMGSKTPSRPLRVPTGEAEPIRARALTPLPAPAPSENGETTYAIIKKTKPRIPMRGEPGTMETDDVLVAHAAQAPIPALPSERETRDIVRPSKGGGGAHTWREATSSGPPSEGVSANPGPWDVIPSSGTDTPVSDHLWEPHRGPHAFWLRAGTGFALGPCTFEEVLLSLKASASTARSMIEVSGDGVRWMRATRFAELTGEAPESDRPMSAVISSGRIEDTSTTALFGRIGLERATGRLDLERRTTRQDHRATLHVVRGEPVHVSLNVPGFALHELLFADGSASPSELAACMHVVVTAGRPLDEIVAERGSINLEQLRPRVMRARLEQLVAWDQGSYTFSVEPPRPEPAFAQTLPSLLPTMLARAQTADQLRAKLLPLLDVALERTEIFERILDELALDPVQREGVAPFGATRNLREAILYSEAGERFALTLAFILHELGALRVRRSAPTQA